MKRLLALILFALLWSAAPSQAQVFIVTSCGSVPASQATLVAGRSGMMFIDVNGNLCTAASVSASITGFPTVQSTGTPISVTTSSATGTLPAGAVVVASNVGATNGAYCKLGASATVNDQLIPPNSWFAFTVGANTQLSCITSTSTTTVNMVGGSGLPTGSGGGGGGAGGSSSITNWGGGVLGAMANYGTSPGAVPVPGVNAFVTNTLAAVGNNADGVAAGAGAASPVDSYNYLWNGSSWDRMPGSTTGAKVVNGAADPCQTTVNSTARGNITSATTTRIITPSASNKTYICSIDLVSFAANNVAVVEGTGGTCVTGIAGVIGGTTTANGISFAAQQGLVKGGAGFFVWSTAGTNVDFCLITSTAGPLGYFVKYVQAP